VEDSGGKLTTIAVADAVRVTQMDQADSFRSRLDGNVEFGFSYSGSTLVGLLSLAAEVTHRDRKRLWGIDLSIAESDAPETGSSGTAAIGGGRYLIQNTNQELRPVGGLVGTREEFADGHQNSGSELMLGVDYDAFRFDSPELQPQSLGAQSSDYSVTSSIGYKF
jgi:hypothetical protein